MRRTWLPATFFLLLACAPQSKTSEKPVLDIDGLIDGQLAKLGSQPVTLYKEAGVKGANADTTFVPDAPAWRAELEVFRSLGMLNQKVYAGTYRQEGPLEDPRSNLLIRQYENTEAPLRWVRLYYQDAPERIRQVEGEVLEATPLYTARRVLSLWFEDDRGVPVLSRYTVSGYQKIALRDTVHFEITGVVRW